MLYSLLEVDRFNILVNNSTGFGLLKIDFPLNIFFNNCVQLVVVSTSFQRVFTTFPLSLASHINLFLCGPLSPFFKKTILLSFNNYSYFLKSFLKIQTIYGLYTIPVFGFMISYC